MIKGSKMPEEHRKNIAKALMGHVLSEETKKKISKGHIGKKLSKEHCKKISKGHLGLPCYWAGKKMPEDVKKRMSKSHVGNKGCLGYKHTEEAKENMRKAQIGRKQSIETRRKMSASKAGEKSNLWKGGISSVNKNIRRGVEIKIWKENVLPRDDWTCQKTGVRGGKLEVHHIKNFADYPESRFDIDNGITLSIKSHKEFHHIYGNKNNTREQLEEFLGRPLDINNPIK